MNGAIAESANITISPTISRTNINGANHHFLLFQINKHISLKKSISFAD
jgi:hypothetical protein